MNVQKIIKKNSQNIIKNKNIEDNFYAQNPKDAQCKKNLNLKDNNLTNYYDKCKCNLVNIQSIFQ